jgi:hypothetical protein
MPAIVKFDPNEIVVVPSEKQVRLQAANGRDEPSEMSIWTKHSGAWLFYKTFAPSRGSVFADVFLGHSAGFGPKRGGFEIALQVSYLEGDQRIPIERPHQIPTVDGIIYINFDRPQDEPFWNTRAIITFHP